MHQEDLAQCATVSVLKEDLMDIDDKANTVMKKPSTSKMSLPFKVNKSNQIVHQSYNAIRAKYIARGIDPDAPDFVPDSLEE